MEVEARRNLLMTAKNIIIIAVAFITGVLGPLSVQFMKNRAETAKMQAGVIDTNTLLNHSLFTHARTWVSLIIPQTRVSEEARKFLQIKFTYFQKALEDLVRTTDFNSLSDEQLHAVISSRGLGDVVVDYLAAARRAGVSEEFISAFSKWHARVVDILVNSIEANVNSTIYTSQNGKVYAILTAYDQALGATITDVEKTLKAGKNGSK
jgi:hypothetical protein